jgi:hypothetical protein
VPLAVNKTAKTFTLLPKKSVNDKSSVLGNKILSNHVKKKLPQTQVTAPSCKTDRLTTTKQVRKAPDEKFTPIEEVKIESTEKKQELPVTDNNKMELDSFDWNHPSDDEIDIVNKTSVNEFILDDQVELKIDMQGYTYPLDNFRRNENITKINGDGNCLFRSLLASLNLQDDQHVALRKATADWMEKNVKLLMDTYHIDETETLQRINTIKQNYTWGDDYEIFAFEKMSNLKVIVYQEIYNDKKICTHTVCVRGLNESDDPNTHRVALLFCKMDKTSSGVANHYNSIMRDIVGFQGLIDKFLQDFLIDEKPSDELNTRAWPDQGKKPPGKAKLAPECYIRKIECNNFDAFELESINGINTFSFLRKGTWIEAFYTRHTFNKSLGDNKVNFINFTDKNSTVPKFTDCYSKDWTKQGIAKKGINNVLKETPKNLFFDTNISVYDINSRYTLDVEFRKKIPHAICFTCSGRSEKGTALFRYYENLYLLIEHCRNHENKISAYCFANLDINPDQWIIILAAAKPRTLVLVEKKVVSEKLMKPLESVNDQSEDSSDIDDESKKCPEIRPGGGEKQSHFNIFGWNARSAFKEENKYFISKFLVEQKPDFLLINESGVYKDNITKTVGQYDSYHSGDKLLAYCNKNISVTPIWKESWDGVTMILKITLMKKSMILINVYRPPSNEIATDRIIAVIKTLDCRYKDTPIVIFGDLNYRREKISRVFQDLVVKGFKIVQNDSPSSFTRSQQTILGLQKSYLDYFLIKNIQDYNFSIELPIGNSDHKTLKLNILDQEMRIERQIFLGYKFSLINKQHENIYPHLLLALNQFDPITSLQYLVNALRFKFRPSPLKIRSHFKILQKLKDTKDWDQIRKIIRESSRENFVQFLSMFETLKASRKDKEYFLRLRFYSDLNKNTAILTDMKVTDKDFGDVVTIDKTIINGIVNDKYRKLFEDTQLKKSIISLTSNEVIEISNQQVIEALNKLNLKKATSWDFIPGETFSYFIESNECIMLLTNLLNALIKGTLIPDQLSLARLLCLNKNAQEPGTVDTIRPIVIVGLFWKLIEYPLQQQLKLAKLNKAQLGFREKLSTELNLLRLRQRVKTLLYKDYNRKTKLKKIYILFLDFSQAFDSVKLEKLVRKLLIKKVPVPVVNTLIKMFNSSKISINLLDIININAGVGQGKICSPTLFNIFIDDLLDITDKNCNTSLAFADDTAFINESFEQLTHLIQTITEWSLENEILINKKKSGIIILNDDGKDSSEIMDFPVVSEYKYLGVIINCKITPRQHIHSINSKIKGYLKRNEMLHRKYFSPFSLLLIMDYFVKSRLSYGMCCFLDHEVSIKMIEKTLARHLKSIFKLPTNTSLRRLLVCLGEPDLRVRLATRLLKNWHKYFVHFGEYPTMYLKPLEKYFTNDEIYSKKQDISFYSVIKIRLINKNLKDKASEFLDCHVRDNHKEFLKKYIMCYPDGRDYHLIRFFTNTTKGTNQRLFPKCICGADNTPRHAPDECEMILSDRSEVIENFKIIFDRNSIDCKLSLYDYLHQVYYSIDSSMPGKDITKLVCLMKHTILRLIVEKKIEDEERIEPHIDRTDDT